MPAKVLLVHGYGFIDENNLGIQSETICKKILRIQNKFDEIIFLGGWHDQNQSPVLTSGKLMKDWLLDASVVDECKLHTIKEIFPHTMPPRDTAEEVGKFWGILRLNVLSCLSEALKNNKVFAIGLWYHIPRIKLLYNLKLNGLGKVNMIPAFSWQTIHPNQWSRIVQEPVGLVINWLDPNGNGSFMQRLRRQRTACIPTTLSEKLDALVQEHAEKYDPRVLENEHGDDPSSD